MVDPQRFTERGPLASPISAVGALFGTGVPGAEQWPAAVFLAVWRVRRLAAGSGGPWGVGMAGRREVPVDPEAGPVQRLAFELRKLRMEAGGITYRVLAQRAGYSVTTLSQAAAGEQLPTLPVVLAYVTACGGDGAEWEERWKHTVEALADSDPDDGSSDGAPPYRGLARFEATDHSLFFGRDQLTADLLDLLSRQRFAALFGPSGSGKSSLLRAGLIPALQQAQDMDVRPAVLRILTPGPRPARTHSRAFNPPEAGLPPDGADAFVIVDQFEEVFTVCQDPAERARFIDMLLAARRPERGVKVLIAVRADFYGRCAEHRGLTDARASRSSRPRPAPAGACAGWSLVCPCCWYWPSLRARSPGSRP
ncbi:helix-turn-helix domain-containing protein [Streptomyces sp. NPDC047718]|uniref:helix-turn-helix domain-containing protein n=1 Tax=Streptomyces sp. NPDC047718 TaxID=3155479 RepID=UPI00340B2553